MRLNLVTWKRLWAVFVALAVTLAFIVVPNARAQEDIFEDELDAAPLLPAKTVEFGEFRVSNQHYYEGDNAEEIRLWEFATFDVDWTAPEGVVEGQTFTVQFPEQFRLYGDEKFNLVSTAGVIGGTCDVDANKQSISCVFNEKFVNKYDVKGTLQTKLQAHQTVDKDELSLIIDGKGRVLDLPGKRGIIGPLDRVGGDPFKVGWFDPNWSTSGWRIDIPGTKLESQKSNPVKVTDEFDGYFKFTKKTPFIEAYKIDEQNPNVINESLKVAEKNVSNYDVSADGKKATFEITPPNESGKWEPNLHYRIRYEAETLDGRPVPVNTKVTNHVVIAGLPDLHSTIERNQHSSGTIQGVDRGSYKVRKVLADSPLNNRVPADAEFTVHADITLPNGQNKTEEVKVSLNGERAGNEQLPVGSTVILSEVTLPNIPGVEFGKPKFSVDQADDVSNVEILEDGAKARITTVSEENIDLLLTNTVKSGSGKLAVVKKTAGVDVAKNKDYKFNYECNVEGEIKSGVVIAKGDEQPVFVDEIFPIGTTCTITEDERAAQIDGYTLVPQPQDFKQTITISGDDTVQVTFINTYARMAGGLAVTKHIDDRAIARISDDEEFKFEASWEANGKVEKREFTLRDGDVFDDFPRLPLGTKVTIKELLPDDSMWVAPVFTANVSGAVDDKGDGTAVVTVLAEDANLLVNVTNSMGRGPGVPPGGSGGLGWLALLGLIPLLGGLGSSQSGGSSTPGAPAPSAPAPNVAAPGQSPDGVGGGQPQKGVPAPGAQAPAQGAPVKASPQLARTGAGVLGVVALALVAVAVGVFLVRRARRQ
ncbi:DUF5979 domain-containing protein [Corynebacterium freiburgense]|uniref:DUF5979 domain-containing protein n=1 Tax=Corynebacterium freiburgense TaxID=556548 RepID=UPI000401CC6D|nr:DUF5979 domain-containing protein [Corynebacterium freiburgense]WJZ03633.1 hypothetical protein CFREI_11875 [Corynebacterium freiburgense]